MKGDMNENIIKDTLIKHHGGKYCKTYNIHGLNGLSRLVLVDPLMEKKSSYTPRDPAYGMDMDLSNQNSWSEEQIIEKGTNKLIQHIFAKKDAVSSRVTIGTILLTQFFEYRGIE